MDLIIGGGKYGEHAFQKLRQGSTPVIVMDTDPTAPSGAIIICLKQKETPSPRQTDPSRVLSSSRAASRRQRT